MKKIIFAFVFLFVLGCSKKDNLIMDEIERQIVKCAWKDSEFIDADYLSYYEQKSVQIYLQTNESFERAYAKCEAYQKKYPKTFARKYDVTNLEEDRD